MEEKNQRMKHFRMKLLGPYCEPLEYIVAVQRAIEATLSLSRLLDLDNPKKFAQSTGPSLVCNVKAWSPFPFYTRKKNNKFQPERSRKKKMKK